MAVLTKVVICVSLESWYPCHQRNPSNGSNRVQSYPAFPLPFSKSLPSDSPPDSIRGLVKPCRCNNDGRGFSEVDGQPTPVALMGDVRFDMDLSELDGGCGSEKPKRYGEDEGKGKEE